MKNGRAAWTSGIVSEMAKAAVEAGVDIISDLLNLVLVEPVSPAEW